MTFDRQDPVQLKVYIEEQMARLGCDELHIKRWPVPRARVEKGLRARIGVGAMVWNRHGQVLLVRHHPSTGWDPDKWFTPGGVIEEGELPEVAVKREVMEEVGLEVDILRLSRVNNEVLVHEDLEANTFFFQFEVMAMATTRGDGPRPREGEILEVQWFDEPPENMAFKDDYMEDFRARRATFQRSI